MHCLVCTIFHLVAVLRILFVCKGLAVEAKDRTPAVCAYLACARNRAVCSNGEMCGRPTAYGTFKCERPISIAVAAWRG